MSRRSAYLLAWGVAFLALAIFIVEDPATPLTQSRSHFLWELGFGVSGLVAILGAATRPRFLDVLGFILLTCTSGARAAWYLYEYLIDGASAWFFGVVVWGAVAVAQVIVAGWPDSYVEVEPEQGNNGDS